MIRSVIKERTMDVTMEASREIMWNIPLWMKVGMYLALAVATGIFLKGLYEKFLYEA